MIRFVLLAGLGLTACSAPVPKLVEICGNGKDDDSNGLTDCQDPDCSGQNGCPVMVVDGGHFGACPKCGNTCTKQGDCIKDDYSTDRPLPECVGGRCQALNTNVQVHFEIDTQGTWNGFTYPIGSMNTRFLSKLAPDGSAVSCSTVQAAALGKTEADADQIEKGGKFNVRGYDVTPVQAMGGVVIQQNFLNVGTGPNFLIWTELWAGKPGSLTKLPSGNRYGWGCTEAGVPVGDVVATDHCSLEADAGPCRTIRIKMPGPQ